MVTSYRQFETILSLNKTTGDVLALAGIQFVCKGLRL